MAANSFPMLPGISLVEIPGLSTCACIVSDDPDIVGLVRQHGSSSNNASFLNAVTEVARAHSQFHTLANSHIPVTSVAPARADFAMPSISVRIVDDPPVDDDSDELLAFDRIAAARSPAAAASVASMSSIDPESLLVFKCACGKQCTSSSGLSRHRKTCDKSKSDTAPAPEPVTAPEGAPDSHA